MAKQTQTIDINVRLNLVPIENDDLLILRGVHGEEEVHNLLNALIAKAERDGGKVPTVVALEDGQDIEHVDEEAMRSAGWVRSKLTDPPPTFAEPVAASINEALLRSTDDAAVWAAEFAKVCPDVDEGLMISWFANAIESAKDILRRTLRENY